MQNHVAAVLFPTDFLCIKQEEWQCKAGSLSNRPLHKVRYLLLLSHTRKT